MNYLNDRSLMVNGSWLMAQGWLGVWPQPFLGHEPLTIDNRLVAIIKHFVLRKIRNMLIVFSFRIREPALGNVFSIDSELSWMVLRAPGSSKKSFGCILIQRTLA